MKQYDIQEYVDSEDRSPFGEWLLDLKDKIVQAKITARIDRASYGNFGDWKAIKGVKGLFEMREHCGAGYRVFYALIDGKMVLLLAGSSKKDQKKAIAVAADRLVDYQQRRQDDDQTT